MKRLAGIFAAVAMLATTAASVGCVWWLIDEPKANNLFND
ncbi:MAG: cyclic lactone autoinducer peptide [Bacilli bacterium]|nr:cyclic lactone autoinducer peptide [Bacilli bacterium]